MRIGPSEARQYYKTRLAAGRQKSAAPTRVNLGPHHILETITDRKLKLYVRLHSSGGSTGGVRWVRMNPPIRPDPGVVVENARTGRVSE